MSRARDIALKITSERQDAIAVRRLDTTNTSVVSRGTTHVQRQDVVTAVDLRKGQGADPTMSRNSDNKSDRQKTVRVGSGGAPY